MAKKSQRDPNAPKRNLSAYLLYQNAMRDHFKAQNPGMTFGQLAKYTSAMYAEMPPHEKEAWNVRAESDKARYLHQLASYVPPPGFDAKGDAIQSAVQMAYGSTITVGKRRKTEKDPNAPKRNVSAYLLYQNAMREQFKRENPDMTFGQLAKYTSHMYKNLTPDEKATWDARAQQDKARYNEEIARYIPPPGHDARGNLITPNRPGGKRMKRGPKDPAAPKRARGSFVFFTFEMRPIIMQENPNVEFVQMGTLLGERWRALLPEQKKRYEDMASQDKIRFQVEMEKYKANLQQQQLQQQQNMAQANVNQAHLAQAQLQHAQMNAVPGMPHQQAPQHFPSGMPQQHYYTTEQQQQVDPNQQQFMDPNQQQPPQQHDPQAAYEQQQQDQAQQQQLQQQYEQQQQLQQQQYDPNQQQQQQYEAQQQQYDPNQQQQQQFEQQQQQQQQFHAA